MGSKWTKIATVRKDIKGNNNIVFGKGITILKDGEPVELGKYMMARCFDSGESVENLVARGSLTDDEKSDRLSYIAEKKIKFDVVVPPSDRDNQEG